VTIVEMLPRLVPVEDEEVSKELARIYRKRGINFHTSAKVDKVEKTKAGVSVTITVDGKQQKIDAEKILIAIGRKPRTANIGLERTKIKPDREFIKTDSGCRPRNPAFMPSVTSFWAPRNWRTSGRWKQLLRLPRLQASPASQSTRNIFPARHIAIQKSQRGTN